jgi:amphi-Trp domain-containing protein
MLEKNRFRHESLQDKDSIQDILNALAKGIAKGELSFSDEDSKLVMQPKDLLNLKLTASENEAHKRIDIRISWYSEEEPLKKTKLKVE